MPQIASAQFLLKIKISFDSITKECTGIMAGGTQWKSYWLHSDHPNMDIGSVISLKLYRATNPVIPFRSSYPRILPLFVSSCMITTSDYNLFSIDTINALRESILLIWAYPRIARWLIANPHHAFHNNVLTIHLL